MSESRNNMTTERRRYQPSFFQSLLTGCAAGVVDVSTTHPLWVAKYRKQKEMPFTMNPRILYRGFTPNALSTIPNTALQIVLNDFIQKKFTPEHTRINPGVYQTFNAFAAGVASAFIICPTEMLMTYQNNYGGSLLNAYRNVTRNGNPQRLFRGLMATTWREGNYTMALFGIEPMLKSALKPWIRNNEAATLCAGFLSGLAVTILSQPMDAIKTIQQSSSLENHTSIRQAIRGCYSRSGFKSFFAGGISRGASIILTITLIADLKEKIENYNLGKKRCL